MSGFDAVGCGAQIALGSLHATQSIGGMSCADRVRAAREGASMSRQRTLRVKLVDIRHRDAFMLEWTDGRKKCQALVLDRREVVRLQEFAVRVNEYRDERARELGLPAPGDEA